MNPTDLNLSEEDFLLLIEIKEKLNHIPEISDLSLNKKTTPIGQTVRSTRRGLGDTSDRSLSQQNLVKYYDKDESKDKSAVKESLAVQRKSSFNHFTAMVEILNRENENFDQSTSLNQDDLISTVDYYNATIQEMYLHYDRFRIACVNSEFTIKTLDYFLNILGGIIYGSHNCFAL
jgi:hypothetical protein